MKREILRVEQVSAFSGCRAYLKNFDLTVYQGEIMGVTGLADSGMTCIADVMSGKQRMEKGKAYLHNRRIEIKGLEMARKYGIHVVSPNPLLFETLTLEENVCLMEGGFFPGLSFPSSRQIRRMEECRKELNLPMDLKTSAMMLTMAEKHMVEMLRTYYTGGSVLVVNQILGGCTSEERKQMKALLLRLRQHGMGIVVLDTKYEMVRDVSDVILIMRNGRVEGISEGGVDEKRMAERISLGDYRIPDTCKTGFHNKGKRPLFEWKSWEEAGCGETAFRLYKGEVMGIWDEGEGLSLPLYGLLCGEGEGKRGEAKLDGREIWMAGGRKAMIRQGFGYVEDCDHGIFPKLTVKENLTLSSLGRLTRRISINRRLEQTVALDKVRELEIPGEDLKKPIETVSRNTRFLIMVHRWILGNARVLVFNHALVGADLIMRNSMIQTINLVHRSDLGLILFSTDKKELYELCDQVYAVKEGGCLVASPSLTDR